MSRETWDTRIQRAEQLAARSEAARELLTFYGTLLRAQKDGYEHLRGCRGWLPSESPVANPLHPAQSNNPVARVYKTANEKLGTPAEGFNVVCTTYRLTEHYHYWTKNNPMNVQLVPEPFIEIPAQLADEMGLRGGELVRVSSARGAYVAKAMFTKRIKPMMIDGKKTYQIGIPIHWGYRGIKEAVEAWEREQDARELPAKSGRLHSHSREILFGGEARTAATGVPFLPQSNSPTRPSIL